MACGNASWDRNDDRGVLTDPAIGRQQKATRLPFGFLPAAPSANPFAASAPNRTETEPDRTRHGSAQIILRYFVQRPNGTSFSCC
jgi:hypothetical protein